MKYKFLIEKNIPIPPLIVKRPKNGKLGIYPFKKLKSGDSFFVPTRICEQNTFRQTAYQYTVRYNIRYAANIKFTVRKVDGGCRIWRIE